MSVGPAPNYGGGLMTIPPPCAITAPPPVISPIGPNVGPSSPLLIPYNGGGGSGDCNDCCGQFGGGGGGGGGNGQCGSGTENPLGVPGGGSGSGNDCGNIACLDIVDWEAYCCWQRVLNCERGGETPGVALNAGKTMYSPPYSPGSPTGPCSGMPPIPVAIGTPTPAPVPASGGTYSQVVTVTNGSNSVEGMLIYCATSGVSYTSTCAGVEFSHDLPGSFQYFVYAGVGTICPSGPTQQFTGNEATVANPPATSVVLNVT